MTDSDYQMLLRVGDLADFILMEYGKQLKQGDGDVKKFDGDDAIVR